MYVMNVCFVLSPMYPGANFESRSLGGFPDYYMLVSEFHVIKNIQYMTSRQSSSALMMRPKLSARLYKVSIIMHRKCKVEIQRL